MLKKVLSFAIALLMIAAMAIPAMAADVTVMTKPTDSDYTVIRGYSGEKGSYSITANKLNLNGSGVVSTANKIVWNPSLITGEAGIVFTVTYNEDYTSVGSNFEDYRFAVALMDSQSFQGKNTGNGLGVEYRLSDAKGTVRAMGLYYKGSADLNVKYPNRNLTLSNVNNSGVIVTATENRSVKCKITYNSGNSGLWKIWIDSNNDGVIDAQVAEFNPADSREVNNNNVGQYFPTDLLSGGEGFLVFGSYNANKMNCSISIDQLYGGFSFGEKVVSATSASSTAAYTVGDNYVQFIAADDSKFVTADSDGSWTLADKEGAIGGKAIHAEKTATNADGSGITVKFYVPKTGDYTVWGRVFFENQLANSMFYKIDGGTENIWDLPDEDVPTDGQAPDCYGHWQYFYLTYRKAGTYSADSYGDFTVQYNEWRHAPNVLHLEEGYHTIKLTAREAGVYLDELVITDYTTEQYDPNAYTGNTKLLDSCRFCGDDAHYYSDVLAETGESAQSYFVRVLHTGAKAYELPIVKPNGETTDNGNTDGNGEDNAPADGDNGNSAAADNGTQTPSDTTAESAEDTEKSEKKGCGSSIALESAVLLTLVIGSACVFGTKKKKVK